MSALGDNLKQWMTSVDQELSIQIDQYRCQLEKHSTGIMCYIFVPSATQGGSQRQPIEPLLDISDFLTNTYDVTPTITNNGQHALSTSSTFSADIHQDLTQLLNTIEKICNLADAWMELHSSYNQPTSVDSEYLQHTQVRLPEFRYQNSAIKR